jgi:hypothetical protein
LSNKQDEKTTCSRSNFRALSDLLPMGKVEESAREVADQLCCAVANLPSAKRDEAGVIAIEN